MLLELCALLTNLFALSFNCFCFCHETDVHEYMLGNPVQEKLIIGSTVQDGAITGQVVYSGRPAEHSGKLIGIEYFAVRSGDLDVRVNFMVLFHVVGSCLS